MCVIRLSQMSFLAALCLALACATSRQEMKHSQALAIEKRVSVPAHAKSAEIIQIARGYLGAKYKFGASTAQAIDCSAFVQLVFRKEGIKLPRSSYNQAQFGHFIANREELQPGDLVFFETYHQGPSHVGIYLGNKRFIHASTGQNRVTITALDSSYYNKRYLGGKRILKD